MDVNVLKVYMDRLASVNPEMAEKVAERFLSGIEKTAGDTDTRDNILRGIMVAALMGTGLSLGNKASKLTGDWTDQLLGGSLGGSAAVPYIADMVNSGQSNDPEKTAGIGDAAEALRKGTSNFIDDLTGKSLGQRKTDLDRMNANYKKINFLNAKDYDLRDTLLQYASPEDYEKAIAALEASRNKTLQRTGFVAGGAGGIGLYNHLTKQDPPIEEESAADKIAGAIMDSYLEKQAFVGSALKAVIPMAKKIGGNLIGAPVKALDKTIAKETARMGMLGNKLTKAESGIAKYTASGNQKFVDRALDIKKNTMGQINDTRMDLGIAEAQRKRAAKSVRNTRIGAGVGLGGALVGKAALSSNRPQEDNVYNNNYPRYY